MPDRPIASVQFTDGVQRVFLDEEGRQYVQYDAGNRMYGVWVLINELEIVENTVR